MLIVQRLKEKSDIEQRRMITCNGVQLIEASISLFVCLPSKNKMTLSLLKNVPTIMAMTLGMVSMIAPVDAQTPIKDLIFSLTFRDRTYTCHTDYKKNPYVDCVNSMAILCNQADATWSSDPTKKTGCHNAVDKMYGNMNDHWQNVRKACGQWPFTQNGTSYTGVYPSTKCASANQNLTAQAYLIRPDGVRVKVTRGLTDSINVGLWSKVTA